MHLSYCRSQVTYLMYLIEIDLKVTIGIDTKKANILMVLLMNNQQPVKEAGIHYMVQDMDFLLIQINMKSMELIRKLECTPKITVLMKAMTICNKMDITIIFNINPIQIIKWLLSIIHNHKTNINIFKTDLLSCNKITIYK